MTGGARDVNIESLYEVCYSTHQCKDVWLKFCIFSMDHEQVYGEFCVSSKTIKCL